MFEKNGSPVTEIKWTAPTQNTDGSPITQNLVYNLYIDGVNTMGFPGTLNPNGQYSFPLDQVAAMAAPGDYTLTLTAVDEDGDESDPSNAIVVTSLSPVPNAPAGLEAG